METSDALLAVVPTCETWIRMRQRITRAHGMHPRRHQASLRSRSHVVLGLRCAILVVLVIFHRRSDEAGPEQSMVYGRVPEKRDQAFDSATATRSQVVIEHWSMSEKF